MLQFKNIENRKNITYELANDDSQLTNQDKKKLFKLFKKVEEGKSISEKLKERNYNTQKLLTAKIIYKDEKKEGTLTLLCQSMFYKNDQAFHMLLQEAINQRILQDVLSEKLIQKLPNGLTITYTALVSCILEENSKAIRTVLEASKKDGILKEILNRKVKVEKAESQEISYTLLDYANKHNCKESAKILKEFEEILSIEVKNDMHISDNAEVVSTRCEDANKGSHEIHEAMLASSEDTKNISKGDAIDQAQGVSILSTTFTEVVKSDQTQSCYYSKSRKGSAANEESLTEIKNKRKLIKVGRELREKLKDNSTWESKAIGTDTQSHKDINEDKEDFQLIFENKERAETEFPLPKGKMVSKRRLISLDPVLLDNEDNEDLQLTFENSKKSQNSSIKTVVQKSDISGSFPFQQCFNSDAEDRKEKSLTKATQQRRGIIAGGAGVVLLLVGSVASYIMKMHVIAVIGGIVGLACIGFALYNSFKPNTKLEKVEDPAQPVIVHSHLNTT